jgi:hypothetical protein
MSHGSEEEGDNYWPGYVDALTSMVQVLAFVMMMLAMAVFVLSQNVSKAAIEAIANAIHADVKPEDSIKQLTQNVLDKLDKLRNTSSDPAERPKGAVANFDSSGPTTTPEASNQSETEKLTGLRVGKQRTNTESSQPRSVPDNAPRLTVTFEDKSYKIDGGRAEMMVKFIGDQKAVETAQTVMIEAFAFTGDGALSEARRLAYYRAMVVRKQLIDSKVIAQNIRMNVLDTNDKARGSTVEIIAAGR